MPSPLAGEGGAGRLRRPSLQSGQCLARGAKACEWAARRKSWPNRRWLLECPSTAELVEGSGRGAWLARAGQTGSRAHELTSPPPKKTERAPAHCGDNGALNFRCCRCWLLERMICKIAVQSATEATLGLRSLGRYVPTCLSTMPALAFRYGVVSIASHQVRSINQPRWSHRPSVSS